MKVLPLILCLLLFVLAFADDSSAQAQICESQLSISSISVSSSTTGDFPDSESILDNLLLSWKKFYGDLVHLSYLPDEYPDCPRVSVGIEYEPAGTIIQVTLSHQDKASLKITSSLSSDMQEVLLSCLAGNIFYLWAKANEFSLQFLQAPPRFIGRLRLKTLSVLQNWEPAELEPVDLAAGKEGLTIAFPNRFITLGPQLQITALTMRDLSSAAGIPSGFMTANICLNPIDEPVLFNAEDGTVVTFNPYTGDLERFQTGCIHPAHFTGLPRGGFALLKGRKIQIFFREEYTLRRDEIELPHRFFTTMAADQGHNIWIFDLKERRIRIFNIRGKEIGSVKPILKPSALPFPQVFRVLQDGSFLLGGSGELWRFNPNGLPLWRLISIEGIYREALPAFFKLAATGNCESFFLLDPLSGRILKFFELYSLSKKENTREKEFAELFSHAGPGDSDQTDELLQFCRDNELYLMAYQITLSNGDGAAARKIKKLIKEKQAHQLAALAQKLENELLLPEAESIYGKSLKEYRDLRTEDPIDPLYPGIIKGLNRKRIALRKILYQAQGGILDASFRPSGMMPSEQGIREPQVFRLHLMNNSTRAVERLVIKTCFSGISKSLNHLNLDRIVARDNLIISFDLDIKIKEDLRSIFSVQASFIHGEEHKSLYFRFPVILKGRP